MARRTYARSTTRGTSRRAAPSNRYHTDEGVTAWLSDLFAGEDRGTYRKAAPKARRTRTTGKMTRSEAGRAGGLAPHRCRGRQCTMMRSSSRTSRRAAR
jgi:hypothetical protein